MHTPFCVGSSIWSNTGEMGRHFGRRAKLKVNHDDDRRELSCRRHLCDAIVTQICSRCDTAWTGA